MARRHEDDAACVAAAGSPAGEWFLRRARAFASYASLRAWLLAAPCAYCLGVATTIDHIVPRSAGGTLAGLDNMAPACVKCNGRKGDVSVLVFLAIRHAARADRPKLNVHDVSIARDVARARKLDRMASLLDDVLAMQPPYNRRRRRKT